jgi:hypothetical protein
MYIAKGIFISVPMKLVIFNLFFCAHLPSVLLLLLQSRFTAGSGLGTGLGTTISDLQACS